MRSAFKMAGLLILFSIAIGGISAQARTLVITGITGHSGDVMAVLATDAGDLTGSMAAVAQGRIASGRLNFQLVDAKNESRRWSDSGEFYVVLIFENSGNAIYYYTQGGRNALKYNVASSTTTLAYKDFSANIGGGGDRPGGGPGRRGETGPKTLAITGITGHSGDVMAVIATDSFAGDLTGSMVAVAQGRIARNSLSFQLIDAKNERQRWSGTGEYYIVLIFENSGNAIYEYSQGGRNPVRYNIVENTTTLAYNQFTANSGGGGRDHGRGNDRGNDRSSSAPSATTYIVTGGGGSFSATKGGSAVRGASGAIQAVVDAIKADANGGAITVQFGNGAELINLGAAGANFGSGFGTVTVTGKVTSNTSANPYATVAFIEGASGIINGDISTTNSSWYAVGKRGNGGTLTVVGGAITGGDYAIDARDTCAVTINGGAISGRSGVNLGNSATLSVTGGAISGTYAAIYANNNSNPVTVTGGTISGTGSNGVAIYNLQSGIVTLSNTTVTSTNTNAANAGNVSPYTIGTIRLSEARGSTPILVVGSGVRITNTAGGVTVFNPKNAVITGWKP